jgi:hypothetical protein
MPGLRMVMDSFGHRFRQATGSREDCAQARRTFLTPGFPTRTIPVARVAERALDTSIAGK